ncbi:MAG: hypothetical protein D6712_17985, partial [Chloroflexi bacterium]
MLNSASFYHVVETKPTHTCWHGPAFGNGVLPFGCYGLWPHIDSINGEVAARLLIFENDQMVTFSEPVEDDGGEVGAA